MESKTKTLRIKKNLNSFDVCALARELAFKLEGTRVVNIYDINQRTYLFKFGKGEKKESVLIESGIRIHSTTRTINQKKVPSAFTMKFRKFLRGKRVDGVRQVGVERVIVISLGAGDSIFHLILEFYAAGNIILTDANNKIIMLTRSHAFTETEKTSIGSLYPFHLAAPLSEESLLINQETIQNSFTELEAKDKRKIKAKDFMFKMLPCLPPVAVDHFLQVQNVPANSQVERKDLEKWIEICQKCKQELFEFRRRSEFNGFLIKNPNGELCEFSPFLFKSLEGFEKEEKESFCDLLDFYFFSLSPEKESEAEEMQKKAWKKYENIKADQESRLEKLRLQQESMVEKAKLIEANIESVDAIINIISTMVSNSLSFEQIERMVSEARREGDEFANMISKLDLINKVVVVLLQGSESLEDDCVAVEIDFSQNAFTNAQSFYQEKKKQSKKEQKTVEAAKLAISNAEKKAKSDIKKMKEKVEVNSNRKAFWFEKFYWFISSENFLVLSGRDAQQNELLVKKYLRKNDIFLHADFHGAAITIVRNDSSEEIPRNTLDEAAVAAACRSKAWDAKILPNVYWVFPEQVSKSAPSGEYLPVGSFMIRGKKNFVQPMKLEMGFTVLFKVEEVGQRELRRPKIEEKTELEARESVELTKQGSRFEGNDLSVIESMNKAQVVKEGLKGKGENKKEEDFSGKSKKNPVKDEPKTQNTTKSLKAPSKNYQKKMKKAEEKYAFQDEEEKALNMKLLGSKKMQHVSSESKPKEETSHSKGNKQENSSLSHDFVSEKEKERNMEPQESKGQSESFKEDDLEVEANEEKTKKEETTNVLQEENEEIEEEKEEPEQSLDLLVGNPLQNDTLLFAMAMCAPYNSLLTNYKLKVKVSPGTLKKGKAAKTAIHLLSETKDLPNLEKKLLNSIGDVEMVNVMIGNAKVAAPGMLKMMEKEKKKKKENQK